MINGKGLCGEKPHRPLLLKTFHSFHPASRRMHQYSCLLYTSVPAGSYLTVPFGHGGTSRAACSGWVRWNLNTEQPARMSPSHPVLARAPLCCRCISPLTPGFQTTRCPARTDRPMNFLLCTARHCVKAACPALCCAALGCSRPRCVRCCPRTPAFPVLAGIITSMRPTLTANLFISGCSAAKSPLLCFPGKPAYSEPWRHTWSKAGISGPATESKSKTNLLAHFLLQSSRASLADVRLFFYIFAALASAQEKRTDPERQHCCSFPVAPSAAMSSCRSVMASPLLAKHMDVNGVPPAAWGHTPAVWSTK